MHKPFFLLSGAVSLLVVGVGLFAMLAFLVFGLVSAAKADPSVEQLEGTLTWVNPTENADGTPLTDHGGTKVYCSLDDEPVDANSVTYRVTDPSQTSVLIGQYDPPEGNVFCRITAYDKSMPVNESVFSNTVNFTFAGGQAFIGQGPAPAIGLSVK